MVKDSDLVNGNIAVYEGKDYWCQARYNIGNMPVVMVNGKLHTVSDWDEALCELKPEYQPKDQQCL